jgi:hypothetical protein
MSVFQQKRPQRYLILLVVSMSLALRLTLAAHGGQLFWTDEGRYGVSRDAAALLLNKHPLSALGLLFGTADHLLFKIIALVPALLGQAMHAPLCIPAFFFALVSTWVIWLVGRVALAASGDETEALIATFLAATTASLFYYSRHFFPYDLSLSFFLVALAAAFDSKVGFRRSFLVGFWTSMGFLTYNGYWMVGCVTLAAFVLMSWPILQEALARLVGSLLGLILPITGVLAIGHFLGTHLLNSYVQFSTTVTQGNFGIAWRFIPEYFYSSERGIAVAWCLISTMSIVMFTCHRVPKHLIILLTMELSLYGTLIIPSDIFSFFAVSARHARALAPFLCLTAASTLAVCLRHGRLAKHLTVLLLALVALQAGLNFAYPLKQMFPAQFRELSNRYLSQALTSDLGPYEIINGGFLNDPTWSKRTPVGATVLIKKDHPFQYEPYLYEGYTEHARDMYRQSDLSMRLVRLLGGLAPFADYPGIIKLTLQFPEKVDSFDAEPLVSTGKSGEGDMLFFRFAHPNVDPNLIQIGRDRFGEGVIYSKAILIDRSKDHVLIISMGSLFPPSDSPLFRTHPDWLTFKQHLYVTFDGEELFKTRLGFYDAPRNSIAVGMNLIGASTAGNQLTGRIVSLERVPPESLVLEMPPPINRETFAVSKLVPGRVSRMTAFFPAFQVPATEPLFTLRATPSAQVVFVRYIRPKVLRFGISGVGLRSAESEEVEYDSSKPQTMICWAGTWATSRKKSIHFGNQSIPEDRRFAFIYNGRTLIDVFWEFDPRPALTTLIGQNPTSTDPLERYFGGHILSIDSLPYEALLLYTTRRPFGALDLAIKFPSGREGTSEPIITTGRTGAGDFVYVRYLPGDRLQFGFDHWGIFGVEGNPISVDFSATHRLEISIGSLYAPRDFSAGKIPPELGDSVEVRLDGRLALSARCSCYSIRPEDTQIGANSIGGSTTGRQFTGQILSIRRLDRRAVSIDTTKAQAVR